jgi:hypothetical protein
MNFFLNLLPYICSIVSIIIGFKAYSRSVKNEIQMKYLPFTELDSMDDLIESEYNHQLTTIMAFCMVNLLLAAISICLTMMYIDYNILNDKNLLLIR